MEGDDSQRGEKGRHGGRWATFAKGELMVAVEGGECVHIEAESV
jgi:hypothetical protein